MIKKDREITDANTDRYNIESEIAVLISKEKRATSFPPIEGMGRSNIWYGTAEMNEKVVEWINNYEKNLDIK